MNLGSRSNDVGFVLMILSLAFFAVYFLVRPEDFRLRPSQPADATRTPGGNILTWVLSVLLLILLLGILVFGLVTFLRGRRGRQGLSLADTVTDAERGGGERIERMQARLQVLSEVANRAMDLLEVHYKRKEGDIEQKAQKLFDKLWFTEGVLDPKRLDNMSVHIMKIRDK